MEEVGEQPQLKKVRTIEVGFEDIAVDLGEAHFPGTELLKLPGNPITGNNCWSARESLKN